MSPMRTLGILLMVVVVLLAGWQAARGDVDWLAQCGEGQNPDIQISSSVEQPQQKCMGLYSCGDTDEHCRGADGTCDIYENGELVTVQVRAQKKRSIKVGECETPQQTNESDKCWHCVSPKGMICTVEYHYKFLEQTTCTNRCAIPHYHYKETGKCKE